MAEEKGVESNSRKIEDGDEKPQIAYPLQMKVGVDDDAVSVSISVVRDDEPMPVTLQPDDKDVVTVTRIPQECSEGKPLQDLINSNYKSCIKNAEGMIQSKLVASGKKKKLDTITTVLDTQKVTPFKVNADTHERKDEQIVKMDSFICFPYRPKKEADDMTPKNSSTVSILKESLDASIGFCGVPSIKEESQLERTKRKAGFENIILNKPQRSLLECFDAKGTVSSTPRNQSDFIDTDIQGQVPDLGGVCYTVMPTQRKRISICVDNKRIRACTSLGVRPVTNTQDTNSILQNLERFKLKQQSGGLIPTGNLILANNKNKLEGGSTKTIRLCEMNRNLQNNCVKLTNISEKDVSVKNSFCDLSALMNVSERSSVTEKSSVDSFSSLKKSILNRNSDLKYVVYDNSKSRLVPASVPAGSKRGYNIVTSSDITRSADTQSCSNVTLKTAVNQKETLTPLYVAIVSSANAHAAGTTTSISASTVKNIMTAVGNSSQQTKKFVPQVASSVTSPSCPAVRLLQPVSARTVCVAGKKLVSVQRTKNRYMIYNKNQLYTAHRDAVVVPARKPLLPTSTNLTNSSSSSTNEDSIPVFTVPNPKAGLHKDSPPDGEASSVKTSQPLECSTNAVNQTIQIKRLLPRVCDTLIPNKVRRLSCDVMSDTDVPTTTTTNFTKLTLTTQSNSIASHTLKPNVVSATQTKPVVSIRNSYAMNIIPTRLESSSSSVTLIPVAKEVSSASVENLKKSSTVCFRTVASNIPISKLIAGDSKSVESKTINLKIASPMSARKLFMVDVMKPSSDIPCSSDNASSDIGETENVSDKEPLMTGNNSEEREISQNDSISSVRIADTKSENDISNLKTSHEKSQNGSTAHDTSSAESKSQNDLSTIRTLSDRLQTGISSVRKSSEKLQNKIFYVRRLDKKLDSPNTSSPKSKCKAQEDTGHTASNAVRVRSKRNMTKAGVEMMVTRSSGRRR